MKLCLSPVQQNPEAIPGLKQITLFPYWDPGFWLFENMRIRKDEWLIVKMWPLITPFYQRFLIIYFRTSGAIKRPNKSRIIQETIAGLSVTRIINKKVSHRWYALTWINCILFNNLDFKEMTKIGLISKTRIAFAINITFSLIKSRWYKFVQSFSMKPKTMDNPHITNGIATIKNIRPISSHPLNPGRVKFQVWRHITG